MKRTLILFFLFFLPIFSMPVYAHRLKIDGSIGATLHIEPDDAPAAGDEIKFFVDITDTSKQFDPGNPGSCICTLTIERDGETLASLPVVSGNMYTQLRYTFAEAGSYVIRIEGKPNNPGARFQPFHMQFETYVAPGSATSSHIIDINPLRVFFPYVAAGLGCIILLMFLLQERRKS